MRYIMHLFSVFRITAWSNVTDKNDQRKHKYIQCTQQQLWGGIHLIRITILFTTVNLIYFYISADVNWVPSSWAESRDFIKVSQP